MHVSQNHFQILAQRYIAVGVNHQLAEYTLATQFQMPVAPFVIQSHEVIVLLGVMNTGGNLPYKIFHIGFQKFRCRIEELHRAVDTYTDIYVIFLCYADYPLHILETIPRG